VNFAKFIDWPGSAQGARPRSFSICVLGSDPFGPVLDSSLAGKSLGGQAIAVRRCQTESDARSCEIVFVSRAEAHRLPEILQGLRGTNALVVGESNGFAASGGAIEFFLQQNHVRLRINPEAAASAGLTISSKLLALADIVHEGGANNGKS